jgi:hypothetical protein
MAAGTLTPSKDWDVSIFDADEQRALFDRTVQGDLYASALMGKAGDAHATVQDMMRAKKRSDMLSSMLQGFGMRYASRLRHMAAAMSRRAAIAAIDADSIIALELNK